MDNVDYFDEQTIQRIFGHEAAEDENENELQRYYFKNTIFEKAIAPLPLRILVGHKGIGKSALFKISYLSDKQRNNLSVWIRPDDITDLKVDDPDFLRIIRSWKDGVARIISHKILQSLGYKDQALLSRALNIGGHVISFLFDTFVKNNQFDQRPVNKAIVSNYLRDKEIHVYIDDLDRGWTGSKSDIRKISALLNALRDLSSEDHGLMFRVALRSDVYFLVRTADESTDKIEGSVIWYKWTNHEILALLAKRVLTYFGDEASEAKLIALPQLQLAQYLNPVIENQFHGKGKWEQIPTSRMLMTLIRRRPRDLVKLCTLAARHAADRHAHRLGTEDFQNIFEDYSQGRIQDTINEYRSELPTIEKLIMGMRPTTRQAHAADSYVYATDELITRLKSISDSSHFQFANGAKAEPKQLLHFLYKINFITARKALPGGEIQRKYFEENRYLYTETTDFGYAWEVHPAYRWALQPDNVVNILDSLQPTSDDE